MRHILSFLILFFFINIVANAQLNSSVREREMARIVSPLSTLDLSPTGQVNIPHAGLVVNSTFLSPDGIFQVDSTDKGSRPFPMMSELQRDAIITPTQGLFVYNLDTDQLNQYDGLVWGAVAGSGGGGTGNITEWTANNIYATNDFVYDPASNNILRAQQAFTSTGAIDFVNWFVLGPSIDAIYAGVQSSDGVYTVVLPQDITPTATPTFDGLVLTGPITMTGTLNIDGYMNISNSGSFSNVPTPTGNNVNLFNSAGGLFYKNSSGEIKIIPEADPITDVCIVSDTKPDGTNYGDLTAGSTGQTRDLLKTSGDCGFLSLSTPTGVMTVDFGEYYIHCACPAIGTNTHRCDLFSEIGSQTEITGTAGQSADGDVTQNHSVIFGRLSVPSPTGDYSVFHINQTTTSSGYGGGRAVVVAGDTVEEVYTSCTFQQL